MAYGQILYRVQDGVAVITLNRPERLNAWTGVMDREVRAAMREASDAANRDMAASVASEDFKEGVAHHLEKRPPAFTGR